MSERRHHVVVAFVCLLAAGTDTHAQPEPEAANPQATGEPMPDAPVPDVPAPDAEATRKPSSTTVPAEPPVPDSTSPPAPSSQTVETAPVLAAPSPEARVVARPILTLGQWRIVFSGFVQVDAIAWNQASLDELDPSTREPLNQTRLNIPRARLRADAQLDGVAASVEFDGNTSNGVTGRLLGAYLQWSFPERATIPLVVLTAGLVKIPFGVEVPSSERDEPFLEPPAMSRALFPGNYDLGAIAHGGFGLLRWSLALMNGAPVADRQWTAKDPTSSYDFVGRVGLDVPGPRRSRVAIGVSALRGTGLHPGIEPTKSELQWIDEDQDGQVDSTELQVLPGSPGEPSKTFGRNALGLDVDLGWCLRVFGSGRLFGELAYATNLDRALVYADPIATTRDLRELGVAIGLVQSVTRHATVGVRYDRYDADRDASQRAGIDLVGVNKVFSTLSVMASGRYRSTRILLQFDHGRNPFGRDDSGLPATRAEDRFTIRAQAEF